MLSWNMSDLERGDDWSSAVLRSDGAEGRDDEPEFEEDAELASDTEQDEEEDDDEAWEAFEDEFDDDEPHPRHRPRSDWE